MTRNVLYCVNIVQLQKIQWSFAETDRCGVSTMWWKYLLLALYLVVLFLLSR